MLGTKQRMGAYICLNQNILREGGAGRKHSLRVVEKVPRVLASIGKIDPVRAQGVVWVQGGIGLEFGVLEFGGRNRRCRQIVERY
jgi:hypothetical protein